MSVTALEQKLQDSEREGTLPKVVVPVHLTGSSCNMAAIGLLAERYGFSVLEDASHAVGGRYQGESQSGTVATAPLRFLAFIR